MIPAYEEYLRHKYCIDCQQDQDKCPDCVEGNLYKSPDKEEGN